MLNSSAAQFIFENRFSSIKVLRSHIEQIPIPAAPPDKMQQIINLTEQISNCENAAEFAKYDRQIDELVWELEAWKKAHSSKQFYYFRRICFLILYHYFNYYMYINLSDSYL